MIDARSARLLVRDLIPPVAITGIAGYAWWETGEMSDFGAIFPQFIAILLFVGAAALAVNAVRSRKAGDVPVRQGTGRALAMLAILVIWAVLLPRLGFVPSSLLGAAAAFFCTIRGLPSRRTVILQVAALSIMVIGMWWLFVHVLNVAIS